MTDRPPYSAEELLAHAGWVRRLARRLVIDPSRADDVEQQTWLRALQARRDPELAVERPRAWLAGIARNVVRETARGDARRDAREEVAARAEALPDPTELVERAELQTRVARAVLELDEPFREALLLRYFEERSPEEIASRLGVPGSTVRGRLARGLARLRERFDREDGDRGTWVRALLPVVLGVRSEELAPLAAGPSTPTLSPPTLSNGGTAMLVLKGTLAVGLALALGLAVERTLDSSAPPSSPPRESVELARGDAAPPRTAPAKAEAAATQDSGARRTPAARETAHDSEHDSEHRAARAAAELAGRVVDADGNPVANAAVFVGARQSPFPDATALLAPQGDELMANDVASLEHVKRIAIESDDGLLRGRLFATMPDGTWWTSFEDERRPSEVYVALVSTFGVRKTGHGAWHELPAADVDFVAQFVPTTTLAVSIRNVRTGELLPRFQAQLERAGQQSVRIDAPEPTIAVPVELGPDDPRRATFRVTEPAWARTSRELDLTPGVELAVELAVELEVDPGVGLRGLVVDATGAPVADALAFWGDVEDLRADPMSGFDPERVLGGARTDADGWFTLPDRTTLEQPTVTVWHERHSPATVAAEEASFVTLPPRGAILGRLVDDAGQPLIGRSVHLDRQRKATTDADGRFRFADVAAGVHGVYSGLDGGPWYVGLVVPAGGELAFERAPEQPTELELASGGRHVELDLSGVAIGLANPFAVAKWTTKAGRGRLAGLPRGRYALVAFDGTLGELALDGPRATVDLGRCDLTVVGAPGTAVELLRADHATNPAVRFLARHATRTIPASGELVYAPLAKGRYELRVRGAPDTLPIAVEAPGTRVTLAP